MTRFSVFFAVALFLGACGRQIGDECRDSIECNNEDNSRTCDMSQPNGYCTIDGCDEGSCPEEAVCMRFFPAREFLSASCMPGDPNACGPQDLCLVFDGAEAGGLCAPRATEKRHCVLKCEEDGDCRDEYRCAESGRGSAVPLTRNPSERPRYCAPR